MTPEKAACRSMRGCGSLPECPESKTTSASADQDRDWIGLTAGTALEETLRKLRAPEALASTCPPGLRAQLRHYQQTGVSWLSLVTGLGLGACLADDMGLGKTVQVIGLLLHRKSIRTAHEPDRARSSLLVVPASLLANWKAELDRFAPTLSFLIVHSSENTTGKRQIEAQDAQGLDLLITTYGMLSRTEWLRQRDWDLVILDEAQAIKNSGTRQSRTVKELKAAARVAMTGTPVENRLSDLWSLFDFLNPGLLGGAKTFTALVKQMEAGSSYQPLRTLVGPYILRRLKTDKRVIADLPEKVEMSAFCTLSREQAALYQQAVRDLAEKLEEADGIQRRGLVLAQLMKLKQICNHPDQLARHGRLLAGEERQVSAPGRALRRAWPAPGEGAYFHAVPRDHRPACTVSPRACSGGPASCFTEGPRSPSGNAWSRTFSAMTGPRSLFSRSRPAVPD